MWSTPFTRGRIKIFLLKLDGYGEEDEDDYCMLVSLMVTLCSGLVLVAHPRDHYVE